MFFLMGLTPEKYFYDCRQNLSKSMVYHDVGTSSCFHTISVLDVPTFGL